MKKNLLVGIIFYNELNNLRRLILNIPKNKNYDICFVNDGSTDGSENLIPKKFTTISHKYNKGYGAAVKSVFLLAKKKKYKYVCIFPGDNQRKFLDIEKLYKVTNSKKKYDIIIGSKFHKIKFIPFRRKIGNQFFSLISRSWNNKILDVMSGFKIYKVKTTYKLLKILPQNYSFDVCLNYLSCKENFLLKEKDVFCNYKDQTSKMTSIIYVSLKILFDLFRVINIYKKK